MDPARQYVSVRLQGGLGNQMFQIAAAYAMAKRLARTFCLVNYQFDGMGQGSHPSKYYDTIFQKIQLIDDLDNSLQVDQDGWSAQILPLTKNVICMLQSGCSGIILKGYFQGLGFFHDYTEDVRMLFTPAEGVISYLSANSSIFTTFPELRSDHRYGFIGVRRGDYLTTPEVHWPCGMAYYTEAMKRMGCSRYYIASDDMTWAKSKFCGPQFRFLDVADDLELLYIMTLFPKYIISNSTYHWWGSFLSIHPNPRIIAPDKWINIEGYETIYTPKMEVLERPVEID
jgi:hypothetical protein